MKYQVTAISSMTGRRTVISFPMEKHECMKLIGQWTGPAAQFPGQRSYRAYKIQACDERQLELFTELWNS